MTRYNILPCDLATIDRVNAAQLAINKMALKVSPKYQTAALGKKVQPLRVLNVAREYFTANVGINPPSDKLLSFKHNQYTLDELNTARARVRGVWALIPQGKRAAVKDDFARAVQMLKDLDGHITAMIKAAK